VILPKANPFDGKRKAQRKKKNKLYFQKLSTSLVSRLDSQARISYNENEVKRKREKSLKIVFKGFR
jgi:hypothetical protein